jgi:transcriptional regulator with XRE-family HTH domain
VAGLDLSGTLPGLLAQRGWTQERLAEETGIQRTDINSIARGRIKVGQTRLERIAAALGVSVLELGAPSGEGDDLGQTLLDRQAELEDAVLKLTKDVSRLARQVGELKRQAQPGARRESTR